MFSQLDERYATAFCSCAGHDVALVRAATVAEATAGYHARLEAERRRREDRAALKKAAQ